MMKNKIRLATVAAALVFAVQAQAALYDITFTGDGSTAVGQIDVVGGIATDGHLQVTGGAAQGTYTLYTWTGGGISSVRVGGGTDLIVDNLVNVAGNPFLDVYGLAFVTADHSEGIDLSLNYGTTYNLAGFGPVGYGVPNANGTATIALAAVPEPTSMIAGALLLLPFGVSMLRIIRKDRAT